jgi:hypothetical protein
MQVLGIHFAPLWIPIERRLQMGAVLAFTLSFTLLPIVSFFVLLYFMFTDYYWIALGYVLWIYYDVTFKKTSSRGGRHAGWLRCSALWRYFRDFFPISLVKTADLDPQLNYLLGYHPHGIIGCGALCNFASEATGFSQVYPGIKSHLMTLKGNFRWPIMRAFLLWNGNSFNIPCHKLLNSLIWWQVCVM